MVDQRSITAEPALVAARLAQAVLLPRGKYVQEFDDQE